MLKIFSEKSSFGLDISDKYIKFVELIETKIGLRVGKYGERKIPPGVIEEGEIKDSKKLQAILRALKKDFGLKSANVTFSNKEESGQKIKSYLAVLKNSGIAVKSFSPRLRAILRSVVKMGDEATHMIVNLHDKDGAIFIVSGGGVVSHFPLIADTVPLLHDEISMRFVHWYNQGSEAEDRAPIKKIILCGGGTGLAEFSEYLSAGMRHKAEVANVWVNIRDTEKYVPEISFEESFAFASPLGLALGDF